MENLLNPYEMGYMKMAMLKHEETFKQQVHELHRVYQVQKSLMRNMEINNTGSGFIRKLDFHSDSLQNSTKSDSNRPDNGVGLDIGMIEENEIELTLGPSSYGGARRKKRLPETPFDSEFSGPSFSSSSSGSSNGGKQRGNFVISGRKQSDSADLERLKQQPWLFQVLNLNIS